MPNCPRTYMPSSSPIPIPSHLSPKTSAACCFRSKAASSSPWQMRSTIPVAADRWKNTYPKQKTVHFPGEKLRPVECRCCCGGDVCSYFFCMWVKRTIQRLRMFVHKPERAWVKTTLKTNTRPQLPIYVRKSRQRPVLCTHFRIDCRNVWIQNSRPICAPWIHISSCFTKSTAIIFATNLEKSKATNSWKNLAVHGQVAIQHVTSHLMCPQNRTKPSCSVKSNNSQLVKNAGLAVYSSICKSKSGVSRKFVQPHRTSTIKNSPLVSPLTIRIYCNISPSSKFLNYDHFQKNKSLQLKRSQPPGAYILLMEKILHQMIGSLSRYLHGCIHPRWLFGISSTNSRTVSVSFIQTSIFDPWGIEVWLKIWVPIWTGPQYGGDFFCLELNHFVGPQEFDKYYVEYIMKSI